MGLCIRCGAFKNYECSKYIDEILKDIPMERRINYLNQYPVCCKSKFTNNSQYKRIRVDISYVLQKMGMKPLSKIDKSKKPRLWLKNLLSGIKTEVGESSAYETLDVALLKREKNLCSDKAIEEGNQERSLLQEVKVISSLLENFGKKESLVLNCKKNNKKSAVSSFNSLNYEACKYVNEKFVIKKKFCDFNPELFNDKKGFNGGSPERIKGKKALLEEKLNKTLGIESGIESFKETLKRDINKKISAQKESTVLTHLKNKSKSKKLQNEVLRKITGRGEKNLEKNVLKMEKGEIVGNKEVQFKLSKKFHRLSSEGNKSRFEVIQEMSFESYNKFKILDEIIEDKKENPSICSIEDLALRTFIVSNIGRKGRGNNVKNANDNKKGEVSTGNGFIKFQVEERRRRVSKKRTDKEKKRKKKRKNILGQTFKNYVEKMTPENFKRCEVKLKKLRVNRGSIEVSFDNFFVNFSKLMSGSSTDKTRKDLWEYMVYDYGENLILKYKSMCKGLENVNLNSSTEGQIRLESSLNK